MMSDIFKNVKKKKQSAPVGTSFKSYNLEEKFALT